MKIRKLEKSDKKEFLNLLSQLTDIGNITDNSFNDRFNDRFNDLSSNKYLDIYVIIYNSILVACGTIYIEPKFIHNCGKIAHIEDIVVKKEFRGKGLGKQIIEHLKKVANLSNCYKIILSCSKKNKFFYEKCGFKNENLEMSFRF